jgi:hypothetical protein
MQIIKPDQKFYALLAVTLALTLFNQCTDNPFDQNDNSDILDRHVLQGALSLSDTVSKNDIFVWLAGAGISTFTDSHGSFRIQLPNTEEIQGLNGLFSLFYYLGNYRINSSQVFIRDGLFEYGKNDINNEGKIINAPTLYKLLDIHTYIAPVETAIVVDKPVILSVTVELKTLSDPVHVRTYKDKEEALTSMIFLRKNADLLAAKLYGNPYSPATVETFTAGSSSVWKGTFRIPANFFESGEYEVVPYIHIIQANVPDELLLSFGEQVHVLSYDYLKIPFKQSAAVLQVQ